MSAVTGFTSSASVAAVQLSFLRPGLEVVRMTGTRSCLTWANSRAYAVTTVPVKERAIGLPGRSAVLDHTPTSNFGPGSRLFRSYTRSWRRPECRGLTCSLGTRWAAYMQFCMPTNTPRILSAWYWLMLHTQIRALARQH